MSILLIVLLVTAFLSFLAATVGAQFPRINLTAFGLALWVLEVILTRLPR